MQQQQQQPVYVMRGHASPIHALHFYRSNHRLVSADAEGWVVIWNVPIRRPVAVWKAHESAILGVADWNDTQIVTHGRDNKLFVWQVRPQDEDGLDTQLPAAIAEASRKSPWLLCSIDVNALNFCSFELCAAEAPGEDVTTPQAMLLAVPSSRDPNTIDIYRLPSSTREHVGVGSRLGFKTGMPMALKIFYANGQLTLAAGYESGHAVVFTLDRSTNIWVTAYSARPHTQPVLSLDVHLASLSFFTSSADALIVKHPLPTDLHDSSSTPSQISNTRHAGQQSLITRSDGRIFATAGWDSRVRVYSLKTLKEVAVLKWHKEGCYAVTFAKIFSQREGVPPLGEESNPQTQDLVLESGTSDSTQDIGQRRDEKAKNSHWLAAGSKDGRISLWEVF